MEQAIADFRGAMALLRKASRDLDELVQEEMIARRDDDDALHELIDMLPKGYRGTRRIYQLLEENERMRSTAGGAALRHPAHTVVTVQPTEG